jgi:hypothetical protein
MGNKKKFAKFWELDQRTIGKQQRRQKKSTMQKTNQPWHP